MWFLISGVFEEETPSVVLGLLGDLEWCSLKKNPAPQLQGSRAAGQRKDRNDCNTQNMTHILITIDSQIEGG